MDVLHRLLNLVDHERWKIVGVLLALVVVIGMTSCEVTAPGLKAEKVTPTEFRLEVIEEDEALAVKIAEYETAGVRLQEQIDSHNARIEAIEGVFTEKLEFRKQAIELAGGLATTLVTGGAVDLGVILASAIGLIGVGGFVGGVIDTRRKNLTIKRLKNGDTDTS